MSRPLSWYPLAAGDPIPGDPVAVRRGSDDYARVADAIQTAAKRLAEIADLSTMTSDAVAAVQQKAKEVAKSITSAYQRYATVGGSLGSYASQLDGAQAESLAALAAAQAAQRTIDQAGGQLASYSRAQQDATEPEEQVAYQTRITHARHERDVADAALSRARANLEEAVAARDQAARQAIEAIDGATGSDGLNDGWWENWGSKVTHLVSEVFGTIAAIAGIATLFLGWVPILGEVLGAISLIAGAVALIADLVLLIAGEGSWSDVAMGVLALASFGIGRALAGSAKAVRATTRVVAVERAGTASARTGSRAVRAAKAAQLIPARLREALSEPLGLRDIVKLSPVKAWQTWSSATRAEWSAVRSASGLNRILAFAGNGAMGLDVAALTGVPSLAARSSLVADVAFRCENVQLGLLGVEGYDAQDNGRNLINELGLSEPSSASLLNLDTAGP